MLPRPSDDMFKEIESLLFKFLWKGKGDKTRRSTIISQKNMGGAKMTDVRTMSKCLKIAWIKRLISENGNWKAIALDNAPNIEISYILKSNLLFCDFPIDGLKNNIFWKEVMIIWCSLNYEKEIENPARILLQNLWFNSNIKIGKKIVWFEKWYRKDVKTNRDIVKEDNHTFMSQNEILCKYGISTNFLQYWGLIMAIPKNWKNNLIENRNRHFVGTTKENIDIVISNEKLNKIFL